MNADALTSRSILLLDDEEANLDLLEGFLRSEGYGTLSCTTDPRKVAAMLEEHRPDLVLPHLPDVQGDEVLRRLRADPRTARIPVVMISADATPRTIDRLRAEGADAYLTKPLDVDEFLSTIDRLLPEPEPAAAA